ncbi:MAG: hypothetical protein OSB33_06910, partial [Candidatus Poseidoniales archaeon]|nr:hypothetical protein [Candidatus Poseidoniales archaeon]
MQPQIAPAPVMQPAPVAVPVTPLTGSGPDRTTMIHTGLILAALVLASLGMLGDAWSVDEQSTTILGTTVSVEEEVGLDDFSVRSCIAGECTTVEDDLS